MEINEKEPIENPSTKANLCKPCKDLLALSGRAIFAEKDTNMLPTREQFKDFIAAIKHAQEKEDKLDKAFELIWDDDQAQYVPFYISPFWDAIYTAFNIMFGLEDIEGVGNELSWWFDMAPENNAIIGEGDTEINVSDIDAFYDYLIDCAIESHKPSKE